MDTGVDGQTSGGYFGQYNVESVVVLLLFVLQCLFCSRTILVMVCLESVDGLVQDIQCCATQTKCIIRPHIPTTMGVRQ